MSPHLSSQSSNSPLPEPSAAESHPGNCHVAIGTSSLSLTRIPSDFIVADPNQPRRDFDSQSLDRLTQSIRNHGLLNPIRVRWEESLGKYMILTGERRYRAAKQAGLAMVDCIIIEGDLTEAERLADQLTENLLRQDLNPIEKARGMRALMQSLNWTQKRLSQHLQIDPSDVTRSLALLELPDKIQKLIEDGALAPRSAYEITKLRKSDDQLDVVTQVLNQNLDARATERLVRLKNGQGSPRTKATGHDENTHTGAQTFDQQESASKTGVYRFLLHQHNHPNGHIASTLRADREEVSLPDQINTLQAHILVLKREYNKQKHTNFTSSHRR